MLYFNFNLNMKIQLHTPDGTKEIELTEEEALKRGYLDEETYLMRKLIQLLKRKKDLLAKLEKL